MKITVGIPSRGRPLELAAAVLALEKTKSWGNDVGYIVAMDEDDEETHDIIRRLPPLPITRLTGPRPLGLGELHNKMAAATDRDAVFMLWSDRIVPITENWDHQIAVAAMQFPQRVLWLDSIHLHGAGQFILPPAWRAAQGMPCPGVYPFWFEDSHVEEIDALVHGFPRMSVNARAAGPRSAKTNRCRDIQFWIMHYVAMESRRIEEAARVAATLGVVQKDTTSTIKYFQERWAGMLGRAPTLMEAFGVTDAPDASYLQAKANAEAALDDMGVDWRSWPAAVAEARAEGERRVIAETVLND
jgi:hypothetical protein